MTTTTATSVPALSVSARGATPVASWPNASSISCVHSGREPLVRQRLRALPVCGRRHDGESQGEWRRPHGPMDARAVRPGARPGRRGVGSRSRHDGGFNHETYVDVFGDRITYQQLASGDIPNLYAYARYTARSDHCPGRKVDPRRQVRIARRYARIDRAHALPALAQRVAHPDVTLREQAMDVHATRCMNIHPRNRSRPHPLTREPTRY